MAGRKIRDVSDARGCLAEVARSGLGCRAWARAHGVDGRSLNAWLRNLDRREARDAKEPVALRLVELVPERRAEPAARYAVRIGSVVVEVDAHFEDATLRRLLLVVGSC